MESTYIIKKTMSNTKSGKKHVLLLDSQSEVLEIKVKSEASKLIEILNLNSDSGWVYEIIEVKE